MGYAIVTHSFILGATAECLKLEVGALEMLRARAGAGAAPIHTLQPMAEAVRDTALLALLQVLGAEPEVGFSPRPPLLVAPLYPFRFGA